MLQLDPPVASALAVVADLVTEKVLTHGGIETKIPVGEVSAVETMTRDGFAEIAVAWHPIVAAMNYRLDLHAIFVHSRPQVRWDRADGSSGRCELADLLVVVDHKGPGSAKDRTAVLIQAKLLKNGAIRLQGSEHVQFELLSSWPGFTFVTPGYASNKRDFSDESLFARAISSGEYGGIDLAASPRLWVQEMLAPLRTTEGRVSLGELLAGMAQGNDNFGRQACIGGADDWSFTIDELLSVTAALPITKASGAPRGRSLSLGLFVGEAAFGLPSTLSAGRSGKDRDREPPFDSELTEGGPMSTVRLTFTSAEHFEEPKAAEGEQR